MVFSKNEIMMKRVRSLLLLLPVICMSCEFGLWITYHACDEHGEKRSSRVEWTEDQVDVSVKLERHEGPYTLSVFDLECRNRSSEALMIDTSKFQVRSLYFTSEGMGINSKNCDHVGGSAKFPTIRIGARSVGQLNIGYEAKQALPNSRAKDRVTIVLDGFSLGDRQLEAKSISFKG